MEFEVKIGIGIDVEVRLDDEPFEEYLMQFEVDGIEADGIEADGEVDGIEVDERLVWE